LPCDPLGRRRVLLLSLLLAALSARAWAADGEVTGTVGRLPLKHAVVWLEGAPAGSWSPPKEVPLISQRGARFQPEFVVITVGQTIGMPNDDRIVHNVFSVSSPKKFDLGHYAQGDARAVKFDKPGVIDLFCNIHDNMHATVVVVPSSFYAVAGADGGFTIAHVPPGVYKAVAFSPEAGTETQTVRVAATGRSPLTFQGLRP
jgi:plastocyanin